MAEKEQQAYHPPANNGYSRNDEEAQAAEAEKLRLKKRKRLTFFVIFMVSQIVIGIVIGLTIMKVKNPKFRVRSATFETFNVSNSNSSFNMTMNAQLGVKNPNFGPYKFRNTTVKFYYKETLVGTAIVSKSKAGLKTTKKFDVTVDLIAPISLASDAQLASDISIGLLPLRSQSELSGKVELMLIMKKKKTTQMNCTMNVNIKSQQLQDVMCK